VAIDFDGSTGLLRVASTPLTAVPLSMAAFFKSDATSDMTLFGLFSASNSEYIELGLGVDGKVQAHARSTAAGLNYPVTSTSYGTSGYQHACGVWSAINARAVYLDGGGKGTDSASVTPTGIDRMALGATDRPLTANFFNGRLYNVAIWSVALDDAEVVALAKGYSPLRVRRTALVFFRPCIRISEAEYIGGRTFTTVGTVADIEHGPQVGRRGGVWVKARTAVAATARINQTTTLAG